MPGNIYKTLSKLGVPFLTAVISVGCISTPKSDPEKPMKCSEIRTVSYVVTKDDILAPDQKEALDEDLKRLEKIVPEDDFDKLYHDARIDRCKQALRSSDEAEAKYSSDTRHLYR